MIRKAAEEEDSIASASTPSSADISSDLERLDLTPGSSAMSSIYGRNSAEAALERRGSGGGGLNGEGSSSGGGGADVGRGSWSPKRSGSYTSLFSKKHKRRSSSQGSNRSKQQQQQQQNQPDHLARWLTSGNVIYKSVGLGLMDLVVGTELIRLAQEKGIGHHIADFS